MTIFDNNIEYAFWKLLSKRNICKAFQLILLGVVRSLESSSFSEIIKVVISHVKLPVFISLIFLYNPSESIK